MQIELEVREACNWEKQQEGERAPCFALKLAKNSRAISYFSPRERERGGERTIVAEIKLDTRQEEMKSLSLFPHTVCLNSCCDDGQKGSKEIKWRSFLRVTSLT